ncbi:hypothetical protein D3C86_2201930 [compost metagenome]
MHLPGGYGGVITSRRIFMDMQRIHIGTQAYDRRTITDFQTRDQPRATNASVNFEAHRGERIGNVV